MQTRQIPAFFHTNCEFIAIFFFFCKTGQKSLGFNVMLTSTWRWQCVLRLLHCCLSFTWYQGKVILPSHRSINISKLLSVFQLAPQSQWFLITNKKNGLLDWLISVKKISKLFNIKKSLLNAGTAICKCFNILMDVINTFVATGPLRTPMILVWPKRKMSLTPLLWISNGNDFFFFDGINNFFLKIRPSLCIFS